MTTEQASVAEANDAFYRALSEGDMQAMSDIWFPADWAECVHPGWTALYGWEAIRESWRLILEGSRIHVTAADARVRLVGDIMKTHKGQVEAGDVKRVAEEEKTKFFTPAAVTASSSTVSPCTFSR